MPVALRASQARYGASWILPEVQTPAEIRRKLRRLLTQQLVIEAQRRDELPFEEFHVQALSRGQCCDDADRLANKRRKIGETLVPVGWSKLGGEHRRNHTDGWSETRRPKSSRLR